MKEVFLFSHFEDLGLGRDPGSKNLISSGLLGNRIKTKAWPWIFNWISNTNLSLLYFSLTTHKIEKSWPLFSVFSRLFPRRHFLCVRVLYLKPWLYFFFFLFCTSYSPWLPFLSLPTHTHSSFHHLFFYKGKERHSARFNQKKRRRNAITFSLL